MGRKPTSKEKNKLRGNPGGRDLTRDYPAWGPGDTQCPTWVNKLGKELWKILGPELHRLGLLTIANRQSLAVLCNCYGDYRECIDTIKKEGKVIKTKTTIKPHPLVAMAKQYAELYAKLSGEFGLTPSTKSKVQVTTTERDELEDFLGQ